MEISAFFIFDIVSSVFSFVTSLDVNIVIKLLMYLAAVGFTVGLAVAAVGLLFAAVFFGVKVAIAIAPFLVLVWWLGTSATSDRIKAAETRILSQHPEMSGSDARSLAEKEVNQRISDRRAQEKALSKMRAEIASERSDRESHTFALTRMCHIHDCRKLTMEQREDLQYETYRAVFDGYTWSWKPGREIRHPVHTATVPPSLKDF